MPPAWTRLSGSELTSVFLDAVASTNVRAAAIDLARKNAFVAERGKRPVKTAKTGENVDEMQGGRQSTASN